MVFSFEQPEKALAPIFSTFALNVIFNILVATDSVPNTGILLPFFSQGGTSILILLCSVGVILSVARYSNKDNNEELLPEESEANE